MERSSARIFQDAPTIAGRLIKKTWKSQPRAIVESLKKNPKESVEEGGRRKEKKEGKTGETQQKKEKKKKRKI